MVQITRAPKMHVLVSKGCCLGTGGWGFDKNVRAHVRWTLLPWAPTAGEPSRLKANGSTAPATGTAVCSHVLPLCFWLLPIKASELQRLPKWITELTAVKRYLELFRHLRCVTGACVLRKHIIAGSRTETISSETHFINKSEWFILFSFCSDLPKDNMNPLPFCLECMLSEVPAATEPQQGHAQQSHNCPSPQPLCPITSKSSFSHRTYNLLLKKRMCASTSIWNPKTTEPFPPFQDTFPIHTPLIPRATVSMQVTGKPHTVL